MRTLRTEDCQSPDSSRPRALEVKVAFSFHDIVIFQEGVLLACFSDLRQILDLFVSWDWSSYLADYGNPRSKYVRVKPEDALLLLDKLKESENRNMFSGMLNKKDRDKRRLVDTVYKQLKALAQPGT